MAWVWCHTLRTLRDSATRVLPTFGRGEGWMHNESFEQRALNTTASRHPLTSGCNGLCHVIGGKIHVEEGRVHVVALRLTPSQERNPPASVSRHSFCALSRSPVCSPTCTDNGVIGIAASMASKRQLPRFRDVRFRTILACRQGQNRIIHTMTVE